MSESFCLISEPWIPCERLDGSRVELGLSETLTRAHHLRAVADSSPLVTAALHRLLLAILHRCFGPPDIETWKELYQGKRFPVEGVEGYLHKWRHRFDLFHPERPFYQVRGLPFDPDGIDILVTERTAWGGGVSLFQHRPAGIGTSLCRSEAARWLLCAHSFSPGGLVRKPGEPASATAGPLNRGAMVLLRGDSLFETLALNLVVYSPEADLPIPGDSKRDLPAWERDSLPRLLKQSKEPSRMPDGWIDLLTWQSRRLELRVHNGQVTGCVRCVGQGLHQDAPRDPMLAWRLDNKFGYRCLGFDVERAFWRDSHALFQSVKQGKGGRRPQALEQLAQRNVRGVVPLSRRFALDLLGMCGDRASILLVRAERLPVLASLLSDPDIGDSIREILAAAEHTASALRHAVWQLASQAITPGPRSPDKKDIGNLVQSLGAERVFWARAKPAFDSFLRVVVDDAQEARRQFIHTLRREALDRFAQAAGALGTAARVLKGAALAGQSLSRQLPPLPAMTTTEASA